MAERAMTIENRDDEFNISDFLLVLRKIWWKVILLSLLTGIASLLVTLQLPNIYKASTIITPVNGEGENSSALNALSMFGIDIGAPSTIVDLETLFRSQDLTVRVFNKYKLWPIVFVDRYDEQTGNITFPLTERLLKNEVASRLANDWDAIRVVKKRLRIASNMKSRTLTISFESRSMEGSAKIVGYYLEEGKSRLQEEALEKAVKNKKFIENQIVKTADPLTRERLYRLYGQEIEREMMARNREQFGFRVVDSPRKPDRKTKPQRVITTILSIFLSLPIWTIIIGYRGRRTSSKVTKIDK